VAEQVGWDVRILRLSGEDWSHEKIRLTQELFTVMSARGWETKGVLSGDRVILARERPRLGDREFLPDTPSFDVEDGAVVPRNDSARRMLEEYPSIASVVSSVAAKKEV
jgi:hypothetical protein